MNPALRQLNYPVLDIFNCLFVFHSVVVSVVSVFFRKVEYLNAKGSFLDSHTIKAVLKNGTEVQKFISLRFSIQRLPHTMYDIKLKRDLLKK